MGRGEGVRWGEAAFWIVYYGRVMGIFGNGGEVVGEEWIDLGREKEVERSG